MTDRESPLRVMVGQGDAPPGLRGLSVALGNFDGLHAGHRAVIAQAKATADARGWSLGLVCFEPPPRRHFQPDGPGFRLMSARQRREEVAALGVAAVFELAFDASMARLSDVEFIDQVLIKRLGVKAVTVGADFCFGKARRGTSASLVRDGEARGLVVSVMPHVVQDAEKVSSSRIREALASGDIVTANRLLGRIWTVEGAVEQGAQRGRTIGFPTANLRLGAYQAPRFGVYAVRIRLDQGGPDNLEPDDLEASWHDGVANFGRTPTVGLREPLLEVHVFDAAPDLYGKTVRVAFCDFLREERTFASLDALKAQIALDANEARKRLAAMSRL